MSESIVNHNVSIRVHFRDVHNGQNCKGFFASPHMVNRGQCSSYFISFQTILLQSTWGKIIFVFIFSRMEQFPIISQDVYSMTTLKGMYKIDNYFRQNCFNEYAYFL